MTFGDSNWVYLPPEAPPLTLGCLLEPGSLTQRLVASGRVFTVRVLAFGPDVAAEDEVAFLGLDPGDGLMARHVALELDGTAVVVARSICRIGCPVWGPVLDRGGRSLGLTLFSGTLPIGRSEIEFALPAAGHPLHDLVERCVGPSAPRPARRCLFVLDDAPLGVHEVFLPALEGSLAAARVARTA
jgi:chorismate lyase